MCEVEVTVELKGDKIIKQMSLPIKGCQMMSQALAEEQVLINGRITNKFK